MKIHIAAVSIDKELSTTQMSLLPPFAGSLQSKKRAETLKIKAESSFGTWVFMYQSR
jgi:hypothetical protein